MSLQFVLNFILSVNKLLYQFNSKMFFQAKRLERTKKALQKNATLHDFQMTLSTSFSDGQELRLNSISQLRNAGKIGIRTEGLYKFGVFGMSEQCEPFSCVVEFCKQLSRPQLWSLPFVFLYYSSTVLFRQYIVTAFTSIVCLQWLLLYGNLYTSFNISRMCITYKIFLW